MTASDLHGEMLAVLADTCRPYRIPGPLDFLEPPGVLATPEPGELLSVLTARFTIPELRSAGLVEAEGDAPVLVAALARPGQPLIFFRRAGASEPFAVAADCGLLGGGIAALAAIDDERFGLPGALGGACIYLGFRAADVAVLRANGMAAAPVAGLGDPSPQDLERLATDFGFQRSLSQRREQQEELERRMEMWRNEVEATSENLGPSGAGSGDASDNNRDDDDWDDDLYGPRRRSWLCLVGWSPATLDPDPPDGFAAMVDRLEQLSAIGRVDFVSLKVWRPVEADMARFRYMTAHRAEHGLAEAMVDSIFDSSAPWDRFLAEKATAAEADDVATLGAASARPAHVGLGPLDAGSGEAYAHFVERRVVVPLARAALEAPPFERALMLSLAELTGVNLLQAGEIGVTLRRAIVTGATAGVPTDGRFEQYLASSAAIVNLAREVAKCREPRQRRTIHIFPAVGTSTESRQTALPPPPSAGSV